MSFWFPFCALPPIFIHYNNIYNNQHIISHKKLVKFVCSRKVNKRLSISLSVFIYKMQSVDIIEQDNSIFLSPPYFPSYRILQPVIICLMFMEEFKSFRFICFILHFQNSSGLAQGAEIPVQRLLKGSLAPPAILSWLHNPPPPKGKLASIVLHQGGPCQLFQIENSSSRAKVHTLNISFPSKLSLSLSFQRIGERQTWKLVDLVSPPLPTSLTRGQMSNKCPYIRAGRAPKKCNFRAHLRKYLDSCSPKITI